MTTKGFDDSALIDIIRAVGEDLLIKTFGSDLARLVKMETAGELTATQAKQVLVEMIETGASPEDIAAKRGFEAMDDDELTRLVDKAIEDDPVAWQKYCDGEDKVAGVFVGALMKATKGQADGKAVTAQLQQLRAKELRERRVKEPVLAAAG